MKETIKMNKTQLVDAVAKASEIKKRDVEAILESLTNIIQDEVAKGEKVQITGFGSFERRERGERTVKNPRTGEDIKVAPSKSPAFSAGSVFKERVNK
jgi:nucleoid DNA-binding protein